MANLCGKQTLSGNKCTHKVATPGGTCGASHNDMHGLADGLKTWAANQVGSDQVAAADPMAEPDGPIDLMAALKASIIKAKGGTPPAKPVSSKPVSSKPSTDDIPQKVRTARRYAVAESRQTWGPASQAEHLTAWQAKMLSDAAGLGAMRVCNRIKGLHASDPDKVPMPDVAVDPDRVPDVHGMDAHLRAVELLRLAERQVSSATALMALSPAKRAKTLHRAASRALVASTLFKRASADFEEAKSTDAGYALPPAKVARYAAQNALANADSSAGTLSSPERARTAAGILHAAKLHLDNMLGALDSDHVEPDEDDYEALLNLPREELAAQVHSEIGEACELLVRTPGLSQAEKLSRARSAWQHVRRAEARADAAWDESHINAW